MAPEHRGRGLGRLVKLANLAQLRGRYPGVRRVGTWNAHDNTHMIAINEALGFRPHDRLHQYELELAQAGSSGSISAAASGP